MLLVGVANVDFFWTQSALERSLAGSARERLRILEASFPKIHGGIFGKNA
ncbi:MAG TPA: hypothetical protein VHX14_15990 [Thermoanaerobaculia bacterium]|nr:hypothetical protein [Thermoanaerobaculia bacterium]